MNNEAKNKMFFSSYQIITKLYKSVQVWAIFRKREMQAIKLSIIYRKQTPLPEGLIIAIGL